MEGAGRDVRPVPERDAECRRPGRLGGQPAVDGRDRGRIEPVDRAGIGHRPPTRRARAPTSPATSQGRRECDRDASHQAAPSAASSASSQLDEDEEADRRAARVEARDHGVEEAVRQRERAPGRAQRRAEGQDERAGPHDDVGPQGGAPALPVPGERDQPGGGQAPAPRSPARGRCDRTPRRGRPGGGAGARGAPSPRRPAWPSTARPRPGPGSGPTRGRGPGSAPAPPTRGGGAPRRPPRPAARNGRGRWAGRRAVTAAARKRPPRTVA